MDSSPRVTIRDVAEQAGVSVATVSKVHQRPLRRGGGRRTRRVRAVIDELGYEASIAAQSLRNHRTNVIGILVADLEPFSAELLKGAADAIRDTGYELVVYSAGGRAADRVGLGAPLPLPAERHADRRRDARHARRSSTSTTAPRRRGRPAHRPVDAADGRLRQPARRPSSPPSTCSSSATAGSRCSPAGPTWSPPALREQGYRQALAAAGVTVDEALVAGRRLRPGDLGRGGAPAAHRRRSRRPPSSPPTTCRPSPRSAPPPTSASRCRATSRWSASTTSPSRRSASRR